jgi:diguanylate cyclase (GGDEF)-like protein
MTGDPDETARNEDSAAGAPDAGPVVGLPAHVNLELVVDVASRFDDGGEPDGGVSSLNEAASAEVGRQLVAARDRAAVALDRHQAALDRHRAEELLRRVYRDQLTGALQRDVGRDRIAEEIDRAHRAHAELTLAFLDVVGLKLVNDERGHAAGDHLLKMVGEALRAGLRSYDLVVRYGGDEFVCALPNAGRAEARRRLLEVSGVLGSLHPGAQISVGLAVLRDEDTLDALIERADHDLYAGRRKQQSSDVTRAPVVPSPSLAILDEPLPKSDL